MQAGNLNVKLLGRGYAWLDTGTYQSLLDAANFIEVIETRQGFKVYCPEEIAYNMGLFRLNQLQELANRYSIAMDSISVTLLSNKYFSRRDCSLIISDSSAFLA